MRIHKPISEGLLPAKYQTNGHSIWRYTKEEKAEKRDRRRKLKLQQRPRQQFEYTAETNTEGHSDDEQNFRYGHNIEQQCAHKRQRTHLDYYPPQTRQRHDSHRRILTDPTNYLNS